LKTNTEFKAVAIVELGWDGAINSRDMSVLVKRDVVTLMSHSETLTEKSTFHPISGVRGIAIEPDVKPSAAYKGSDFKIALATDSALRLSNKIVIKPRVNYDDYGIEISSALMPLANAEAKHFGIEVNGNIVARGASCTHLRYTNRWFA
jgi:hypothetical protein